MKNKSDRPEGFVVYAETLRTLCLLPDENAGHVMKATARLFLDETEPEELELSEQIVLSLLRGDVEKALQRHAETCERNRRSAKARKEQLASRRDDLTQVDADCTEPEPEPEPEPELEHESEHELEHERNRKKSMADKPPRARFEKPSVEEVRDYCRERRNGIDAQRFVDYYEANGWVQGRGRPLQDWRAAIRTWETIENEDG